MQAGPYSHSITKPSALQALSNGTLTTGQSRGSSSVHIPASGSSWATNGSWGHYSSISKVSAPARIQRDSPEDFLHLTKGRTEKILRFKGSLTLKQNNLKSSGFLLFIIFVNKLLFSKYWFCPSKISVLLILHTTVHKDHRKRAQAVAQLFNHFYWECLDMIS